MTSTTSGLQILVTLSRRYVMTSVMISHIIIWQHQSIVPRNFLTRFKSSFRVIQ